MIHKMWRLLQRLRSADARERLAARERLRMQLVIGFFVRSGEYIHAWLFQRDAAGYLAMQKSHYNALAGADQIHEGAVEGDFVVGSWREHDEWPDYEEYLMRYVPSAPSWLAIEYGCGPGRNLRRWAARFYRIDGVDISATNLDHARALLATEVSAHQRPQLFQTQGNDCGEALSEHYDFAFSTICLQHICVREVRQSIFKSLFRCLRPGGRLSAQMGFGVPSPDTVPYESNYFHAVGTNRSCDVAVASPDQLERDLQSLGFSQFEFWIRPTGPGDYHPNWIFFTALKPLLE